MTDATFYCLEETTDGVETLVQSTGRLEIYTTTALLGHCMIIH